MEFSKTDLLQIDEAARLSLDEEGPSERKPMDPYMPGPLNHQRAFHMVWRLGLHDAPPDEVEAALRKHWPENWHKNEDGKRFGDEWFPSLATLALKEHERR